MQAAALSAQHAAEHAARASYGRLVAILSARTRDIAQAEDALADAFAAALDAWPRDGVPANPPAWLLTVARRRVIDALRHAQVQDEAAQTLLALGDELTGGDEGRAVPDERLRLLFVCAHPAIDAAARAPLMLQTVLGLDVARMAGAFLASPATLGQRLVRAKSRIRAAGISFDYPRASDLPQRLQDVMDGIYAAYGTGWDDVEGADAARRGLTAEAIELGRILCALMPGVPEPRGLLALMLFKSISRAVSLLPEKESGTLIAVRTTMMRIAIRSSTIKIPKTRLTKVFPLSPASSKARIIIVVDDIDRIAPR